MTEETNVYHALPVGVAAAQVPAQKWCRYCCKADHDDSECSCTRPVDWKPGVWISPDVMDAALRSVHEYARSTAALDALAGVPLGGAGAMHMAMEPARRLAAAEAKLQAAEREVEALRADAERYRWLRDCAAWETNFDHTYDHSSGGNYVAVFIPFGNAAPTEADEIDATIDAALANKPAATPACPGADPACPCQDGDACHYRDTPKTRAFKPREAP